MKRNKNQSSAEVETKVSTKKRKLSSEKEWEKTSVERNYDGALSKKKQATQVQYPKGEPRSFEAMCDVIKDIMSRKVAPSKTVLHKSKLKILKGRMEEKKRNKEKLEMKNLCHVLPTAENTDKTLERELTLIATSSVVQLFTQIKKYQKQNGTAPVKKLSYFERKAQLREKKRAESEKSSGVLFRQGQTTSGKVSKLQKRDTDPAKKTWVALSDSYLPLNSH